MISLTNRARCAALISPPVRLSVSDWAEAEAQIPEEGNAEPGKFLLRRMPHQQAMLDDPLEPGVREIYWQMCSQYAGKTLCMMLICEFVISVLRKSLIVVRDTKDRAQEWMRVKFIPTAAATKCMEGLLAEPRRRDSNSTSLSRKFPGGTFTVIGAKSRGAFRGTSAGVVLQDEIDAYENTKEGDPCALADRAAKTFPDAIKLKSSTPTIEGFSRINDGFKSGDRQYYFLPCPHCGEFQYLKWEQLKFTFTAEEYENITQTDNNTKPEIAIGTGLIIAPHSAANRHGDRSPGLLRMAASAQTWNIGDFPIYDTRRAIYVCEHCHRGWTDAQRLASYFSGHQDNPAVIVNGNPLRAHWRATAPFTGIRSRHLSGLYASIGLGDNYASYLHKFAEEFLEAKRKGRDSIMAWTNMFLNECYEDPHEKISWETIHDRAEDYGPELPVQVIWIAWGADVHPDRVEITHYGWGPDQEVFCLDHRVIFCDFDMPDAQKRIEDFVLNKRFQHPYLGPIAASAGAIDSGHQTKVQAVYKFTARHRLSNIFSCKGFDDALGAVSTHAKERRFGGVRLNLNTDYIKSNLIFSRLPNKAGARCIHFPKFFYAEGRAVKVEDGFFQQICSERRMPVRQPNGGVVWHWVKHSSSTRNEALDCMVYAFGVYEVCRQDEWIARKWKEVAKMIAEANPPAPAQDGKREIISIPEAVKQPELKVQHVRSRRKIRIASPFNRFKF